MFLLSQSSLKIVSSAGVWVFIWIRDNSTVANFITFIGFYLTYKMINLRWYGTADIYTLSLIAGAVATDWLDGFLAKKFKQVTRFGSISDKVRDKFLIVSTFWFCYFSYKAIQGLFSSVISIELIILVSLELILFTIAAIAYFFGERELCANRWGEFKMGFECGAGILWAIFNDLRPWGIGIDNDSLLLIMSLSLFVSIVLAYKSIEGQVKDNSLLVKKIIKKVADVIRNC